MINKMLKKQQNKSHMIPRWLDRHLWISHWSEFD